MGVLRCIGARARDISSIFATEGAILALAGWLAGIPLGYAVELVPVWLIRELIDVDVPVVYPAQASAVAARPITDATTSASAASCAMPSARLVTSPPMTSGSRPVLHISTSSGGRSTALSACVR